MAKISMKKTEARTCTIEAPCKINLHLKIGEKRPDGFHNLESLFVALAFGDTLHFEESKNGGCRLFVDGENIPQGENLVLKAVSLFRKRTGFESGLNIRLLKRIPAGAGLGGGSSDAASTLLALNFLSETALGPEELGEMASVLGSDVPFFLSGGAAFVGGRGELIEPVKTPENLWVVLAKPPFSSDTAWAYRLLDESRKAFSMLANGENLSKDGLIKALGENPQGWPYKNDFLPVFLAAKDGENTEKALCYRAILDELEKVGAFAGLSGSGSCCFGVFTDRKMAEKTEKSLLKQGNFTKLTFFLAQKADPVLK